MSETCVAPQTPFDISVFLNGAMNCDLNYMTSIAALPTPSKPSPTANSEGSVRKRRKGDVANPANTLDGLVARRADDVCEPLQKRYLTEQEAIEGPDDEDELKRMEKDPDVSTKTCSACGYQGKWISEIIRHKRVHTNERPFKCRHCSRTSKWKADLIRHVAKTHGYRVVSKYSRSKNFESSSANRGKEEKGIFDGETDLNQDSGSPTLIRPQPLTPWKSPLSYRCVHCLFEQEGISIMLSHLRNAHNVSPYECRCGVFFDNIDSALHHSKAGSCDSNDLVVNITPIYNRTKAAPPSIVSLESLSPSGSRSDSSPECRSLETEDEFERSCDVCPFQTSDFGEMRKHKECHVPKDRSDYKCAFCPWFSSRATEVEEHMRVHTLYPQQFMAVVERNLTGSQTLLPSPLSPTFPPQGLLTPSSPVDLASALMSIQNSLAPSYLASLTCLLSMSPSAFTPVAAPFHHCSRCDARFRDAATLATHSTFHSSGRSHTCPLCDYAASRASNLVRHVQTHHRSNGLTIVESLAEEAELHDDPIDVEL